MSTETALSRIEPNYNSPSIRPASSPQEAIQNSLLFPKTSLPIATEFATRLVGLYPNGKPSDPETYIAAIVAVLHEYPHEVVAQVCSPVHGVARTVRFLPTIAEISDALEAAMIPLRRQWSEQKERAAMLAQRNAPKAIADAGTKARVAAEIQRVSDELAAAPDPVPPKRAGNEPTTKPVSLHASRVMADLARKRST